jgi:hypothetical protein
LLQQRYDKFRAMGVFGTDAEGAFEPGEPTVDPADETPEIEEPVDDIPEEEASDEQPTQR